MTLEQFRKLKWGTADGRSIPIEELSDTHLANIINHCQDHSECYPSEVVRLLKAEAESRKLTSLFLDRAPIPWQDTDGKWKRLNWEKREYEVIGR